MDKFKQWLNAYLTPRGKAAEVSRNTNIKEQTLSRWKQGVFPDALPELVRLATFAGVSLDEMLLGYPKNKSVAAPYVLQSRLAKYNLDALPDDERNRLYDLVEILVGILTSDEEKIKTAIGSNLESFKDSIVRRDHLVKYEPDPVGETDRASPSPSSNPKAEISGGNGVE